MFKAFTIFALFLLSSSSFATTAQSEGCLVPELFAQISGNQALILEKKMATLSYKKIRRLPKGKSQPWLVQLKDGTQAVLKPETDENESGNEVAAYLINRELHLNAVPPTVLRTVNGKKASLQFYLKGARDGWDMLASPSKEISYLDVLIGNVDRHGENYLEAVFAIDHGRAFRGLETIPNPWLLDRVRPDPEALKRLQQPTEARLHELLDSYIGATEVTLLARRRDALVSFWTHKK